MTGERLLASGPLSKETSYRLIVSGPIGVREIEMLIRKLEIDKELLAEADDDLTGIEIPAALRANAIY